MARLSPAKPYGFEIGPDAPAREAIAQELGLVDLRKLRFSGDLTARGAGDWVLRADLGATVVQRCVVSLEPVATRIDTEVTRQYLAHMDLPEPGTETEMPEDDTTEPLPEIVDLEAVMIEALSLSLPIYPRKDDADLGEAVFTEPGKTPMRDEDARPFAGLAALRDKLKDDG